jgi:polar amino acid transport system permease protein
MNVFEILIKYRDGFLQGLSVTVKLCLIIWVAGLVLGALLGIAGAKWRTAVGIPSRILSFVLSSIPALVILFWFHYPLQSLLNVIINPFYTAAFTLSLINVFSISDVVRGALIEFPEQYLVAARVCGLSEAQTVWRIQFPIVLREIIPTLLILQVGMLQMTLFASLISVDEIFRVAQRVNAQIYRPIQIYTALGLFFLTICLPINALALGLRRRFTRNLSER